MIFLTEIDTLKHTFSEQCYNPVFDALSRG